jgi:hypothetical protein
MLLSAAWLMFAVLVVLAMTFSFAYEDPLP